MSEIKVDDEIFEDTAERKVVTRYKPLGVVGAIVPWNFPCLLNIGKMYVSYFHILRRLFSIPRF